MPAQEPVSTPGLIETLLWTREEGYFLHDEHLARLADSAAALGHAYDGPRIRSALTTIAQTSDRLRVRLLLQFDGMVEVTTQALASLPQGAVWRAAIADVRLDSGDPLLAYKTTRRQFYDDERARLAALAKADEAIFLNEKGEVCEGGIATIFIERDGMLLTPPLSRGLLRGVLREYLIGQGRAREGDVNLNDLKGDFYLGNSVRGLIPARLVDSA